MVTTKYVERRRRHLPLPGSDAGDAPLVDPEGGAAPAETEEGEEDQQSFTQKLALLGVADA